MHQRLTNNSAKPASGPEYSVPATGCAGTKCTFFGRCGPMSRMIEPLTEPTSETVAPGAKMRADLLGDRAAGADRNADDDQIGAFDRGGIAFHHLIGEAELGHALARGSRTRRRHDRTHGALRAGGARDRGADQPDADQRQAVIQRRRFAHAALPKNSASALTTNRFASSVPTLMRSALGSL